MHWKNQTVYLFYYCLFVHDQINNNLPETFSDYFTPLNRRYAIATRNSKKGKLFKPGVDSTRYGRHSIKQSSIKTWNYVIEQFPNTDFMKVKRNDLKKLITDRFLDSY